MLCLLGSAAWVLQPNPMLRTLLSSESLVSSMCVSDCIPQAQGDLLQDKIIEYKRVL